MLEMRYQMACLVVQVVSSMRVFQNFVIIIIIIIIMSENNNNNN